MSHRLKINAPKIDVPLNHGFLNPTQKSVMLVASRTSSSIALMV